MATFSPLRRPLSALAVLGFGSGSVLVGCGSSNSSAGTSPTGQSSTTISAPAGETTTGVTGVTGVTAGPGAPTGTDKIAITNYTFVPPSVTVAAGTTVTWTNNDGFAHEITENDAGFAGPDIKPGASFSHKYDKAGTYAYHCGIHNYMTGSVTVT
jgi:plastocyanin